MACTLIGELAGDGITIDAKGCRKATRKFLVTGNNSDRETAAILVCPIKRYDAYPTDAGCLASEGKAELVPDALGIWKVTFSYSSELGDKEGNTGKSPADSDQSLPADQRTPTISCGSVIVEEVLGPKDKNGKAVVNSAGQAIVPPIMVPNQRPTITVTGWKLYNAVNDILHKQTYEGKINSDFFLYNNNRFAPRTVRCVQDDWVSDIQNGIIFWKYTIKFEIKFDTYDIEVLDRGTMEAETAYQPGRGDVLTGKMTPILIDGQAIKEPIPLDGKGKRLAEGQPFVYLKFAGYKEVSFNNIT